MRTLSLSFFILLLTLYSCKKEVNVMRATVPIKSLQDVKLKNNRLYFPNSIVLQEAQDALNQEEKIDLSEWYQSIGFIPQEKLYIEVNEAYSKVDTREEYNDFMSKYKDLVYVTPVKSLSINGYYPFLSAILNSDGEVYVGNTLIKFN